MKEKSQKFTNTPEFLEQITILTGQNEKMKLDAATKKKLSGAYFKLYFGLSCVNWANKKSLGAAWQTALSQIDAFVTAKNPNNPAAMYLRQINAAHKTAWPKNIMTHPRRDATLTGDTAAFDAWRQYGARHVNSAMAEIGLILSGHEIAQARNQAPKMTQQKPATKAAPNANNNAQGFQQGASRVMQLNANAMNAQQRAKMFMLWQWQQNQQNQRAA